MQENQTLDKKSLRIFETNPNKISWEDLALDAVAFATSDGGFIYIGIEDKANLPPKDQKIEKPNDLLSRIRKNITAKTERVGLGTVSLEVSSNGGEYIKIQILPTTESLPCTTKGVFAYRFEDTTKRLTDSQDIAHLLSEKNSFVWETKKSNFKIESEVSTNLTSKILSSNRVSEFIKQKTPLELLKYYKLITEDGFLTNIGIVWLVQVNSDQNFAIQ
jgi:ATP-dependent DNA helicase RecG